MSYVTDLLVVDLCSSLAYFMMTHPLPVAGKSPIKALVAIGNYQQMYVQRVDVDRGWEHGDNSWWGSQYGGLGSRGSQPLCQPNPDQRSTQGNYRVMYVEPSFLVYTYMCMYMYMYMQRHVYLRMICLPKPIPGSNTGLAMTGSSEGGINTRILCVHLGNSREGNSTSGGKSLCSPPSQ